MLRKKGAADRRLDTDNLENKDSLEVVAETVLDSIVGPGVSTRTLAMESGIWSWRAYSIAALGRSGSVGRLEVTDAAIARVMNTGGDSFAASP